MSQREAEMANLNFDTFEELFRRNHKFLCMIALSHVKDQYIAEDIVQEFFINFWQRRDNIKLHTSFEAYACRSVKYKSISWLRSQEVLGRRMTNYEYPLFEDPMDMAFNASTKEELEIRILKLIDQLPIERKKIFLMSTTGNYTYAQVAEKLAISVNTVKTQMVKAYAMLREKGGAFLFNVILFYLLSGV